MVDPIHQSRISIFGGSRYQHTLGARGQMLAGGVAAGEQPRALHDKVNPKFGPGKVSGITFIQHFDVMAAHPQVVLSGHHLLRESAVGGIEFKQVRVDGRLAQIIDGNNLNVSRQFRTTEKGPDHVTPNSSKSINGDFYHDVPSPKWHRV